MYMILIIFFAHTGVSMEHSPMTYDTLEECVSYKKQYDNIDVKQRLTFNVPATIQAHCVLTKKILTTEDIVKQQKILK